jgi:hypothetical protein
MYPTNSNKLALLGVLGLVAAIAIPGPSFAEDPTVAPETRPSTPSPPPSTYQTMCVRTCDGYYFPIRQNALPQNFAGDEQTCSSSCGTPARLFYFKAGTTPREMIDLAGRKYSDEPNAFEFQKKFVAGCSCKPAPWSKEAREQRLHLQRQAETAARAQATEDASRKSTAISEAATRAYYATDVR